MTETHSTASRQAAAGVDHPEVSTRCAHGTGRVSCRIGHRCTENRFSTTVVFEDCDPPTGRSRKIGPVRFSKETSRNEPVTMGVEKTGRRNRMLIGYAQVSTIDQDLALQMDALRKAGCKRTFTDKMSSTRADRCGIGGGTEAGARRGAETPDDARQGGIRPAAPGRRHAAGRRGVELRSLDPDAVPLSSRRAHDMRCEYQLVSNVVRRVADDPLRSEARIGLFWEALWLANGGCAAPGRTCRPTHDATV